MTAQRPHPTTERSLDAPLLTFDLPALLTQIKGEDSWHKHSRNGHDLVQRPRAPCGACRHARWDNHPVTPSRQPHQSPGHRRGFNIQH
jgi:hypothetical protein